MLQNFTRTFVFLWTIAFLPLLACGSEADTLFSQGNWRDALQAYQTQFRAECAKQKLTGEKPDSTFSTLIETDSDSLLKAHCLFERGALAFLKKDNALAAREWATCRDALAATPEAGNLYLRRVNMALAQLWIQSLSSKDLKFFQEGLAQICRTIEDSPLPENSADFRYQLQQEYLFTAAQSVFTTIPLLIAPNQDESRAIGIVSQRLTDLWSKKALNKLLSNEMANTAKSHEALVDKVLFSSTTRDTALGLAKKLQDVSQSVPAPAYSDFVSLLCVFRAECALDALPIFANGIDAAKLDKSRLGNTIHATLKISSGFQSSCRNRLLQGISKRPDLVSWNDLVARIEVAEAMARAGCGKEALELLQPLKEIQPGEPIFPRLCTALAQINYLVGDFNESLAAVAAIPQKCESVPPNLYYWKALSYAKLRKGNDAIEALKTFLAKAPTAEESPEACFFLAALCLSTGKQADAQRYFQQTIVSYPGTSYAERAKEFARSLKK